MKRISEELAIAVGADRKPAGGWSLDQVKELYGRAFTEFRESTVGQELLRRGDEDIFDRVIEICLERYETTSPLQTPFYETLEQIGNDLLVSLPKPQAPKAAPKPKTIAAPVVSAPKEIPASLLQFSHLVNEAITNFGVTSLKPHAGYVTVKLLNDRHYDYPHQEFENLYQAALSASLIR
jgi:hypothetical protein